MTASRVPSVRCLAMKTGVVQVSPRSALRWMATRLVGLPATVSICSNTLTRTPRATPAVGTTMRLPMVWLLPVPEAGAGV